MVEERQPVQVSAALVAAKYRSKAECYSFLTVRVKAYLPSHETVTVYFLRDLISGKAKCKSVHSYVTAMYAADVKCVDVK